MYRRTLFTALAALAWLALAGCGGAAGEPAPAGPEGAVEEISLTSPSFEDGGEIPARHACERYGGNDLSPQLAWEGAPPDAQSLALVVTDPDANGFVHWLVYGISPEESGIAEGGVPEGALQGRNGFGDENYGGPCPPGGTHRYAFSLYALDAPVGLEEGAGLGELMEAMDGHVLAKGELVGTFGGE